MTTMALTTTTTQTGALAVGGQFDPIVNLVLDGLTSEHSRRAYGRALTDFLTWWIGQGKPPMSKATVQRYKVALQDDDLAPSTINLRLSAIRALTMEAADNGLVDPHLAAGIARVKGITSGGRRTGNWHQDHRTLSRSRARPNLAFKNLQRRLSRNTPSLREGREKLDAERGDCGNVAMAAGLRPTTKGVEKPPDPKVRAPT